MKNLCEEYPYLADMENVEQNIVMKPKHSAKETDMLNI